ncbi:DNA polymerase theta-like [Homarus americanus]|uniref:DNA polymerase theta-like n=1 Tax=Homarus americanus TaxID=6706 RepID=UPI001C453DBE|nr:DNA polymerase theta-like [Homarus americanus]
MRGRRGRGGRLSGPTNKDVLEKLSKVHPLPSLILQWPKINSSLIKVKHIACHVQHVHLCVVTCFPEEVKNKGQADDRGYTTTTTR